MSTLAQDLDELKGNVHLAENARDGEHALTSEQKEFIKREKAVVRKLDLYITPVMLLLMLISYLDRGNIGFAATQGMTVDIGLKANELSVSAQNPFFNFQFLTILDRGVHLLSHIHLIRGKRERTVNFAQPQLTETSSRPPCLSSASNSIGSYLFSSSFGVLCACAWASFRIMLA